MNASVPRVAVVIPCYGQAHFLREAVESVCAQTFQDLEIVIVDDGSPDDTAAEASRLAGEHPERPIRLVRQANQGLPASRNNAIAGTGSEFVVPLDADDKLPADYVELKVAALDAHPTASIADGDHHTFGADRALIPHSPYDFVELTRTNRLGVAAMFRRRAWEDVGGYNESMCTRNGFAYEDWDFWLGCAERGHFGVHVPRALFYYRVRPDSMFRNVDDQRTKARIVLNHPVLYSGEQAAWAQGVLDDDPEALQIVGPAYEIPTMGVPAATRLRTGGSLEGARAHATLSLAEELLEQPTLLSAYCAAITGAADATLVALGTQQQLLALQTLLRDLGLDDRADADVIGVSVDDPAAELGGTAAAVDAMLTERVIALPVPVPRIGCAQIGALARGIPALAGAQPAQPGGGDSNDGAAADLWAERLDDETAFWYGWLRDRGGQWPEDYAQRMDPEFELQSEVRAYLDSTAGRHLRILDVGSGPLTILGKRWGDRTLEITATDPLAEQYAMLFQRVATTPPVMPVHSVAERLTDTFDESSFDLVYARNCLDHGYDPLQAILQMVKVTKPGCVVLLQHAINEGEHEGYGGLHQWNFCVREGRFTIWQPDRTIDAHSALEREAEVELYVSDDGSRYLRVALRKNR
jgi:SAM-dependent methyltransferase